MGYLVRLEIFEGPFDLLLNLIERDEIDILDIPIAKIAQEYLVYLKQMQEQDLVISGDFLVMAATLLQIKARMLLPHNPEVVATEDEQDPREELVGRLLEYKFFKEISTLLVDKWQLTATLYPRVVRRGEKKDPIYTNLIGDISIDQLAKLYEQVLQVVDDEDPVQKIHRRVSLQECIARVRQRLLAVKEGTFTELVTVKERYWVILTFLAVLELVRKREILAVQDGEFGEIYLQINPEYEEEIS